MVDRITSCTANCQSRKFRYRKRRASRAPHRATASSPLCMCATHFLRRNRECFCPVRVSGSRTCARRTRVGVSRKRARRLSRGETIESVPPHVYTYTHETGNVRFHGSLVTSASLPIRPTPFSLGSRGSRDFSRNWKIKILKKTLAPRFRITD